jgi:hypothetical protein
VALMVSMPGSGQTSADPAEPLLGSEQTLAALVVSMWEAGLASEDRLAAETRPAMALAREVGRLWEGSAQTNQGGQRAHAQHRLLLIGQQLVA